MAQKEGDRYSVSSASKEGNLWKVSASGGYQNIIIEIDGNSGKINYLESDGTKVSMSKILQVGG